LHLRLGGFWFGSLYEGFSEEGFLALSWWPNSGFVEILMNLIARSALVWGLINVGRYLIISSGRLVVHCLRAPCKEVLEAHFVISIVMTVHH